ncbi:Patatin-like phospholipase [Posidoniimonas corsicana]|uniref:Patatin-like phospholipase n=1 Tax=Posidoniimonas corsicana TaxID=1938618 RepID=A0A5C5V6J7_9BACT|nr:patatin-like phospholipase family protein [Posidoniimonas corsicana]TWT33529.1 Patatin-like phospholipase [Posidoniimonas corsicana]
MPKLGLALSGGGYRATLFHLGVVRFLRDAGQLQHVTDVASVSGGSILAAHLVLNWDRYNGGDEQFDEAAAEVVRFVQSDVRNFIVRRLPLQYPLRLLAKLTRLEVRNLTPNAILEHCYEKRLYGDRCLYELPAQPMLHMLATNVSNGGLSVFNRDGLYIQQRPEGGEVRFEFVPARMASIPRVVGASSAFPGLFPPVEVTAADLGVREGEFPTEYFTDGGVFDNLGIRAFSWLKKNGQELEQVVVSDAGKPFQILSDTALGFIGQSVRATDILWDRVWQLERENFGKQDGFVFVPITEMVDEDEQPCLHPVVQAEVQSIRTDLDRFSDEEVNALAQHGYEVAHKVWREHAGPDSEPVAASQGWAPVADKRLPGVDTPRRAAGVGASAPTEIARRLRGSAVRRVWSRLLDPRDWPSYLYLAVAALLLVYLPLKVYQLYDRAQTLTTVNDAIAQGDPDIRRVLELVTERPQTDWDTLPVGDAAERAPLDYDGLEVLSHSRIIDLRGWRPLERDADRRGRVYLHDRVRLRLKDSYQGDRRVTLFMPLASDQVEFAQPPGARAVTIRRVTKKFAERGVEKTPYEFEFDLQDVTVGEPVVLELELLVDVPQDRSRVQFATRLTTDLVSMWMLFPEDRPYRTYNLVQYPADRSEAPTILDSRYKIDHPYGSLIGWSAVNPPIGNIYECRWSYE